MLRSVTNILGLCVFVVIGAAGVWFIQDRFSSNRQIAKLEEEKRVLTQVVQRLTDERRVAEVVVLDQKKVNGILHSTLLFVEYDKKGEPLPPKRFEIEGTNAHIDALVIKFDPELVKTADPLRGRNIALFTSIYGDEQSPASAYPIDSPGQIPDVYRGADPRVTQFELSLWKDFWRLLDDEKLRKEKGVRIANGQGVWWPPQPERLYRFSIEANGGINVTSKELEGIYREMLKQRSTENH